MCGDSEQSVVLLKSEAGRIFGGFCSTHWEDRIHTLSPSFYGNKDCAVWRLTEEKQQPNGQSAASPPLSSGAGRQSPLHVPGAAHASTEPQSPHSLDPSTSLLIPSSQASSIVMDTMLKATHAVEVASAAGLDVAPAVRRASIDTTAMSLGGAGGGAMSSQSLGSGASGAGGGGSEGETTMEVPHVPSSLEIFAASGINSNFMFSSPDLIAMGGRSASLTDAATSASSHASGFAWSIDRDFREGSSSQCDTYRSPVLAEGVEWQCAKLEVWVPVVNIGFRSTAAAAGAASGAAGGDDGSLTISSPIMNISVTPPTAGSPPQAISP